MGPGQPWVPAGTKPLPPVLPGYEHIERFIDAGTGLPMARVKPGEVYVTRADEWIVTTVGSCVAVCLLDMEGRVGGMNHVMLPGRSGKGDAYPLRYAGNAVPELIDQVRRWGRQAGELKAWIYGGGSAMANSETGTRNVEAVWAELDRAGISVMEDDTGGRISRRVMFHPRSGSVFVKNHEVEQRS